MRECRECLTLIIKKIKAIGDSLELNDTQKISLLIVLTVLFTYLPLAIANFGYFDDYFVLNKITHKTILIQSIQGGRILSGFIEQYLFSLFNSIYNLKYIRLISIILISFSSVIFYKFLVKAGFRKKSSAVFSLLTAFTPSMQIYASWAVLSSAPLSIILSTVAAFSFFKFKNFKLFILRSILIWLSLLIYQPSAMIYFALIPIIIYSQLMNNRENLHIAKATVYYVFSGIFGCALAYLTLKLVPIFGIHMSTRAALVTKFYPKLIWFIQFPLIHSTNLLMLQNRYITPVAFILLFIVLIFISKKARNPLFVSSYLYSVPLSYLPNLVVAENWDSNRTLIGLYVIWCGILFLIIENFAKKFKFNTVILVIFILALSYYVQKNIMDEFIVPGTMEVSYAIHKIRKINPANNSTVCIIPSHWYNSLARYASLDDFGTLAFYPSWSATAIFRDVFHQMHKNKKVFFTLAKDNKEKSKCTYFIDTSQVSSFRTYGKLYVVW